MLIGWNAVENVVEKLGERFSFSAFFIVDWNDFVIMRSALSSDSSKRVLETTIASGEVSRIIIDHRFPACFDI